MLLRAFWIMLLLFLPQAARGQTLALVGGTIYPSPTAAAIPDGIVLIEQGKVAAVGARSRIKVPPGSEILDCTGHAVTAGFWNSHVHFMERKWANASAIPASDLATLLRDTFTRYGFTAVFDLSSILDNTLALRQRIDAGVEGPRIFTTGLGLLPPGAQPPQIAYEAMGWMPADLPEVADGAGADAAVSDAFARGANGVKLFLSGPSKTQLAPAAIRAAVAEAHRLSSPVFVHPNSSADIVLAASNGVDIIAHTTPLGGPWDDAVLAAMEDQDVSLIPTLALWRSLARKSGPEAEQHAVVTELAQLRAWRSRGGAVLFGTDLGAISADPTDEYRLMTAAGMDFRAILLALTAGPAKRFGRGADLGIIAPGFTADLVVVKADPAADPRNLAGIQFTVRDGKVIYSAP